MRRESWLIEPHDSLIVRDGRPFNATAGARARSLDFPFPSTLIGTVRTQVGLQKVGNSWQKFDDDSIKELLKIEMFGALLAEIKEDEAIEFFAPAPADSVYLNPENQNDNNLFPLVPLKKDYFSDLRTDLHLLGRLDETKGKPIEDVKFWQWGNFERWLINAQPQKLSKEMLGLSALLSDQRTHVKIFDEEEVKKGNDGYARKANSDGGLFQTRGLEFTTKVRQRLALAMHLEYPATIEQKLTPGLLPLGGERRIVRLEKPEFEFPNCPQEVIDGIKSSGHCRLVLLTPAYFENGFLPTTLNAKVKAVAINRPQVISGWDFDKRSPKPTRRLAPAGTVYFLQLDGDVEQWINDIWFKNIGDCEQAKRDGFGLAALGNWDGTYHEI